MSLGKNKIKAELEQNRIDKQLKKGCSQCGDIDVDSCWCRDDYYYDGMENNGCGCVMCIPYTSDYWYDWYLNSLERVREQKLEELVGTDRTSRVGDFLPPEFKKM